MPNDRITIDFETRSEANLMSCGAYAYSIHPTTDILCLSYKIPGGKKGRWNRTDKNPPQELFDAIADELDDFMVEAHNMFFELCIWMNIGVKKYGWPPLDMSRLACSAAKAAMHALPRALGNAGAALKLKIQKDKRGEELIKKLSYPRKPTKADPREWLMEGDDEETDALFEEFYDYCDADVDAEEELSEALPDLPPDERRIWLLDQKINWRGFYADIPLAKAAMECLEVLEKDITKDIFNLTDGFVDRATKRNDILMYCDLEGYPMKNLQAGTVEKMLAAGGLPKNIERLLKLRQLGGRSSAKKFVKFVEMADPKDNCIRGTLMYHGASTGRWTGKGVQTQNLIRGIFKNLEEIEECIALVEAKDIEGLRSKYENPVEAIASIVRSCITARPGYDLFVADYSSIEARVLVWLADDEDALEVFHSGEDIYIDMANDIFSMEPEEFEKLESDVAWFRRFIGKLAILGLGYQMGPPRFQKEAWEKANLRLDDAFCKRVVYTYRDKYHKVVKLWNKTEKAAIRAVLKKRGPDNPCIVGKVKYYVLDNFLCCELPSGRCIRYHRPGLQRYVWNGEPKLRLTYWGVHPMSKQYTKLDTYGGSLVESICQGVARDIMSYAALDVDAAGYGILTSVHDELVSEREKGLGCIKEYEDLLCNIPAWAEGCPIAAEGWKGKRYKK